MAVMRAMGSSRPMGTRKRAGTKWLPTDDAVSAVRTLTGIAAEDIGRCAYGVFQRPELIGHRVGISGGHLSGSEMAAGFSQIAGEPVNYNAVEPAVYRSFGFPGADDLGNMFQYKRDFEPTYRAARDVEGSRKLNPALQSFTDWLAQNKEKIAIPAK